ncbi:hypothetical protein Cgig2_019626 [Carnegiea gigantea]|uniref:Morc S5 domain-containing protein n=1 Tax=Carnegiea gigantea TaxID=171969 RepID=A0A9Q1KHL7_9CARY|nr:hypothetical protein Cgig2_019626 [Carnegiea gigantea]
MPPAQAKEPVEIVDIVSSDDEDTAVPPPTRSKNSITSKFPQSKPSSSAPAATLVDAQFAKQKLECRSFWQAGAYEIGPSSFAPVEGELEHARVHPKFLHSNATSHKWAFGAIAELLDNAVDEVNYRNSTFLASLHLSELLLITITLKLMRVQRFESCDSELAVIPNGATFVKVDKILNVRDNSPALLFRDDGGGMDPDGIRKCMSLGYSSKKSNTTIGQYGNGFKTSTMRLGADAIVFSRATRSGRATQSVGLLSYTFLRLTGQDDVIVPMFEDIGSHGTKVIIFNLWLNDEGIYELSFDDDDDDIKLRDEANRGSGSKVHKRTVELQSHISYRLRYSLRVTLLSFCVGLLAYVSILYLRKFKNFRILLRGKPVEQFNVADELRYPQVVTYKPQLAATFKEVLVKTTMGFIKEAPHLGVCGFNVYHKNRLIRPFWKVTRDGSSVGNGVVGVLEANFIEPAHDKQDFERSSLFVRLETKMKQMVMEYWKSHCHFMGHLPPGVRRDIPPAEPPSKIQKLSRVDHQIIGLPSTGAQRELHSESPSCDPSAASRRDLVNAVSQGVRENYQKGSSGARSMIELSADVDDLVVPLDDSMALSIEQICEENIQLFARCEEHKQKEHELQRQISKVQKELDETRNKCAQLAAYLETRKRQQSLMQQPEHIFGNLEVASVDLMSARGGKPN